MTRYLPPSALSTGVQLAALRAAFPGWTFTASNGPGPASIVARRVHGTASITATAASARDLRRNLLTVHA
jgi:hypothetical protein